MTGGDRGEVRYEDVIEAEEGLRERGISEEVLGDIDTATWVAAEEILRQHDLPDHVEVHALSRTLHIGTMEVLSLSLEADVIDEDGVQELADAIYDDPLDEIEVVVGRMLARDSYMSEVLAAMQRERSE